MKVLHLLAAGGIGGIETLVRNYAQCSENENIFLFAFGGGIIADELAAMEKTVVYPPAGIQGNFSRLKWILKTCETLQPDRIISHHSSPIFKIALICAKIRMPHIRAVAYAHANALVICGSGHKGYALRRLVHGLGFAAADGVVAISNAVKESLIRVLRVKKEKIYVLPNAIALPETGGAVEQFHDKMELVYVGRLVAEKGVQTIIQALSYGDLKMKVHLTIVGDGEYRQTLQQLACELNVEQAVGFAGTQRDIQPYLHNADVFVHTPECEEGFGLTVIEAMAHGLLCICSDNGALPELVLDGENGFLIKAHSARALYEKIEWVLQNKDHNGSYSQIRENARRCARKYNFETYTQNLENYLRLG